MSSQSNYSQYLRLFQMQLLGVLEDMEKPAESLSCVFSDVLMDVLELKNNITTEDDFDSDKVLTAIENIIIQMQECITGFQFFDAKRQRLENISDGLGDLSNFIHDCNKSDNAINAKELESRIIGLYKMEREHGIYRKFLEEKNSSNELDNASNQ